MIEKSDAASIFRDTRGRGSTKISVPGAFTAVGFSGQQKNPGASAAERGRPSLFKTIDEDRRERQDHINRSGRSTYPEEKSVQTSGATPNRLSHSFFREHNFRRNSDEGRGFMMRDLELIHATLLDAYKGVMLLSGIDLEKINNAEFPTKHVPI